MEEQEVQGEIVVIRFEIATDYDADTFHEDLCLSIHEGNPDASKRLMAKVFDITAA